MRDGVSVRSRQNMTELVLSVQNVKCNGCVTAIQTALTNMTGVDVVSVEKLESNQAKVSITGTFSPNDITNKLTDLGYPVV
jgi:copper chaperone CopZ